MLRSWSRSFSFFLLQMHHNEISFLFSSFLLYHDQYTKILQLCPHIAFSRWMVSVEKKSIAKKSSNICFQSRSITYHSLAHFYFTFNYTRNRRKSNAFWKKNSSLSTLLSVLLTADESDFFSVLKRNLNHF